MAIIRWNPWNIDRLIDEEWDFPAIPGFARLVGQGLNIYETDSDVIIEAAMPGIPEDKIDVTVDDDGIVRVSGSKEESKEEKDKKKFFMSSMSESYNYSFRLPKNADLNTEPACELNNGILKMSFPKVEKQAPRKISIKKATTENI